MYVCTTREASHEHSCARVSSRCVQLHVTDVYTRTLHGECLGCELCVDEGVHVMYVCSTHLELKLVVCVCNNV